MKNNIRLSVFFAAIAALVVATGLGSPAWIDTPATSSTSWSAAFPVAQAGFAEHAPTME